MTDPRPASRSRAGAASSASSRARSPRPSASVLGAAQVLQQQSAEAARELLAGDDPGRPTDAATPWRPSAQRRRSTRAPPATAPRSAGTATCAGSWTSGGCPTSSSDLEVRGAADAVTAMNDGAITGGAVQAQLARGDARARRAGAR